MKKIRLFYPAKKVNPPLCKVRAPSKKVYPVLVASPYALRLPLRLLYAYLKLYPSLTNKLGRGVASCPVCPFSFYPSALLQWLGVCPLRLEPTRANLLPTTRGP